MVGEVVASLTIAMVPGSFPSADGAKLTVRVALCLGDRISPEVIPLAVYPSPVTVTPEIVTFVFPVLVIEIDRELLLPT